MRGWRKDALFPAEKFTDHPQGRYTTASDYRTLVFNVFFVDLSFLSFLLAFPFHVAAYLLCSSDRGSGAVIQQQLYHSVVVITANVKSKK